MTLTVAKQDSTGYSLDVVATDVADHMLPTVLIDNTNRWALFENFIVFSESDPTSHPRIFRVVPEDSNAVYDLGPAVQDPNVNAIWNRLIRNADRG